MGLFKDFKDDFSQAVNEMMPGADAPEKENKAEDLVVNTLGEDVDVKSELSKLDGLLEQVQKDGGSDTQKLESELPPIHKEDKKPVITPAVDPVINTFNEEKKIMSDTTMETPKPTAQSAVQSWGEEIAGGENPSRVRNVQKKLPQTTRGLMRPDHYFVPAGQSTQMVIGASDESDYQIISVSEALYQKFEMKRIFYSAFINVNHDSSLPDLPGPPLLREHRLYQADFLLRFYGFRADELLSEKNPNFNEQIDPKCNWAVHHLELFPVEINRADYYTLLRVPGIGTKSARRIMAARRYAKLDFSDLKKIGVVLKRAVYFITCKGKMMYHTRMEEGYITRNLMYQERPMQMLLSDGTVQTYEQLSLFDDRGKIVV